MLNLLREQLYRKGFCKSDIKDIIEALYFYLENSDELVDEIAKSIVMCDLGPEIIDIEDSWKFAKPEGELALKNFIRKCKDERNN